MGRDKAGSLMLKYGKKMNIAAYALMLEKNGHCGHEA